MKFLLSVFVVLAVVFVVSASASAIDNSPDWVLLIPVVIAAILVIREIIRKPKSLHNFGKGLGVVVILFMFSSCAHSSYKGLTRTEKQAKFQKSHKPTTNEFYDRKRSSWDK